MTRHETTLAPPERGAKLPPPGLTKRDRRAVTGFVERLLAVEGQSTPFFALLRQTDAQLAALLASEAATAARPGPYGRFPPGPLCATDLDGPPYRPRPALRGILGEHLSAALEFAHLLVQHPGDLGPDSLAPLAAAGWSAEAIAELTEQITAVAQQTRTLAQLHRLRKAGALPGSGVAPLH